MPSFIATRLFTALVTLLVASIVIFVLLEIVPGDPARIMLGIGADESAVETLRDKLGLNLPPMQRYFNWVSGLSIGALGQSLTYQVPISGLVADAAAVSVPLALLALLFSTLIAIPVGALSAYYRGRASDNLIMASTQIGVAVPNFLFALLLLYLFAVTLRLFPSGGFPGWSTGFFVSIQALILPAIALALPQAAILSRVTRSAMVEVLGEDYIRTARAKGLTRQAVLWRHALRNALIPVLTILGLQLAFMIAGAIIIENVFSLPGIGRLIYLAINQRDLLVVKNVIMILVATVVFINLVVDILYAWADPRLRA